MDTWNSWRMIGMWSEYLEQRLANATKRGRPVLQYVVCLFEKYLRLHGLGIAAEFNPASFWWQSTRSLIPPLSVVTTGGRARLLMLPFNAHHIPTASHPSHTALSSTAHFLLQIGTKYYVAFYWLSQQRYSLGSEVEANMIFSETLPCYWYVWSW